MDTATLIVWLWFVASAVFCLVAGCARRPVEGAYGEEVPSYLWLTGGIVWAGVCVYMAYAAWVQHAEWITPPHG